jgi:hypothetical protein
MVESAENMDSALRGFDLGFHKNREISTSTEKVLACVILCPTSGRFSSLLLIAAQGVEYTTYMQLFKIVRSLLVPLVPAPIFSFSTYYGAP